MSVGTLAWQLQAVDIDDFLARYWQRKPCVIRQAITDFELPVSAEELAGLACEPGVHARLVQESGGEYPWELRYGPFEENDFLSLPESHYSLLVSDCEKWFPELNELVDLFRFIPSWRIDDLMISYAPDQGSVGPHTDEYDVFLLQATGQRRWFYTDNRIDCPALIPDIDLAILADVEFDHEVLLHPGDMLYLPPGVAHHGIAEGACMTCSIGFRAPSQAELMESVLQEADRLQLSAERYTDVPLQQRRSAAELTLEEVQRFKELARVLLDQPLPFWTASVGKLLSDRAVAAAPGVEADFSVNWMQHPETRLLYYLEETTIKLFANGQLYECPSSPEALRAVQQLCLQHEFQGDLLRHFSEIDGLKSIIIQLMENGSLVPVEYD